MIIRHFVRHEPEETQKEDILVLASFGVVLASVVAGLTTHTFVHMGTIATPGDIVWGYLTPAGFASPMGATTFLCSVHADVYQRDSDQL